ncbi:MAG TPA: DinB family protein, partial [Dehalococcoidia bacterium]|nr:DinB family protein [Dehalococcoidia bacterium]
MDTLQRLVRYNGWANSRVFELCAGLDREELTRPAPGSLGTLAETLQHLVGVEDGYLTMLRGQDYQAAFGSREAYMQQELAWFLQRPAQLADDYADLVQHENDHT